MAQWNKQLTTLDLVKRVNGQMGLPLPTAVVSQTNDRLATQMLFLLNKVGTKLLKPMQGYRWTQFKKRWDFTTVPGTTLYDLPDDWDSFIDQTMNSKSLVYPAIGPVGDPAWAWLIARTWGPLIRVMYRTRGGMLELYQSPASPQAMLVDYTSRGWVYQQKAPVGNKDVVDQDDDIILYDADLIQAALKLEFLREKGFDTTTAQNDFDLLLELAINTDSDAAILNVAGSRGTPLIGTDNIPQSGYGAP